MSKFRTTVNTERGSIWKQVAEWETGFSNDGVFGWIDPNTGYKYQRTLRGLLKAQEAGIYADGVTNMTTKLNIALSHAKVKTLELHVDGGGEILVTGTVTVPAGKVLKFRPGTMIKTTGSGALTGGIIEATDKHQIFSGTKNVNFVGVAKDYVSVNWWGANNGTYENGAVINEVIQCVNNNNTLPTKIYFPDRIYTCTTPVIIYKWSGTAYENVTAHLMGRTTAKSLGDCQLLFNSITDAFGIGIQQGKGVVIEGLTIQGGFSPAYTTQKAFFETSETNYGAGSGYRDTRYTPHAGIVIDPFAWRTSQAAGLPGGDTGYPSFSSWYRGPAVNSGSTAVAVKNCTIKGWIVNYACSVNGITNNADSCTVENSSCDVCKYDFSYGQAQTKGCTITGAIIAWSRIHTLLTTNTHGSRTGSPPMIRDINIAGNVTQLFNIDTSGRFTFGVSNIYAEGLYKLGTLRGQPVTIANCDFNFNLADYPGSLGAPDLYGNIEHVTFVSCVLKNYNDLFDKRIHFSDLDCMFIGCRFDRPPIMRKVLDNRGSRFVNCKIGASGSLGSENGTATGYNFFTPSIVYGKFTNKISQFDSNVFYYYEYDAIDMDTREGFGTVTVTINPATRTGSFTMPAPSVYGNKYVMVGSYLYSEAGSTLTDGGSSANTVLGVIDTFNISTGATVIKDVPQHLSTGSFDLNIVTENYLMQPFCADTTASSTTLSNIEGFFPAVNDRAWAIFTQSYVTAVNTGAHSATLSAGANLNKTDVLFNFPKAIRIESFYPPGASVNPGVFVLKGTVWYTKEVVGGTIEDTAYVFTSSGFINAAGAGGTRQAVWSQRIVVKKQTLSAYTADPESSVYTGATDGEAKLVDLNSLRVAYENLRGMTEDMRTKLISSGLMQ